MTADPSSNPPGPDVDVELERVRIRHRLERDKRLRDDGTTQYVGLGRGTARGPGGLAALVADPYVEPGFTRGPLTDHTEVAIIGGGLAALVAGATLHQNGFDDLRLIDAAGDVGGAWYWNRYPGVMCDIESYIYVPLLEELGYVPKDRYSSGREIRSHARAIAEHYGLYDKACFQTVVTGLSWVDDESRWLIETDRGDAMTARFVLIAGGPLNVPKLPGIPGIEDLGEFRGRVFHTSRWDYSYTGGDEDGNLAGLADKRVGIVGTGATALQVVPHLGRWAEQLYVFQRTPSTVDVRGNHPTDPAFVASLRPGWQRERIENFSLVVHGGNVDVDMVDDSWTKGYRHLFGLDAEPLPSTATPAERMRVLELADLTAMQRLRHRIGSIVDDPATAEALKPWYGWMCKRPGFHDDYLPTFNRPNVTLVDTDGRGLDRITTTGVVANGVEYPLDCLIFATGFETATGYTDRIGYDLVGRDGIRLSEAWAEGIRTLHGMQAHGFPNCFFLGFTQTGITFNYTHAVLEQSEHLAHILGHVRAQGAREIEATAAGEAGWVFEVARLARRGKKYYETCTPGYLTNEGRLDSTVALTAGAYGGGPLAFFEMLAQWRENGDMAGVELR